MCNDCFETEYESFPSEVEWLEFDMELTRKLGSKKMKHIEFKHDMKRDKDDGEYVYVCSACNQKWKLKEPDLSFRGYFVRTRR